MHKFLEYLFLPVILFTAIMTIEAVPQLTFSGKAYYPESAELIIHPTELKLSDDKKFLGSVIEGLFDDYLRLQQKVYFPGIEPYKIDYPYPPITENSKPAQNPRSAFLALQPAPEYYPLKILRASNGEAGEQSHENQFHLYLALEQKAGRSEKVTYNLQAKLLRGKENILQLNKEFAEENAVTAITALCTDLRKVMAGTQIAQISVGASEAGSSVYLNDIFLGKSPLNAKFLSPGKYNLILRKQGFTDKTISIELRQDDHLQFNEILTPFAGAGKLNISSDPPGAKVYLGVEYKGQTPVTIAGLPLGAHRLHLLKEGMGDIFRSVNLTAEKPELTLDLNIPASQALSRYNAERPVLGPLSHKNLFIGSLFFSVAAFSGGVIYLVQRDSAREAKFAGLSTSSPALYTAADIALIEHYDSKIANYESASSVFFYTSLAGVAASFYFYIRMLFDQDIEIAMVENKANVYGYTGARLYNGHSGFSGITLNFAF